MFGNHPLVGRVGVSVDQAHADRFDLGVAERGRDEVERGGRGGVDHVSCRVGSLGDLDDPVAWHGRAGKLDLQVVHVVAMLVADQHRVAEPNGRHHAGATDLAFDQGIGDERRGVNDRSGDLCRAHCGLGQKLAHAGAYAVEWRRRCGEGLVDHDPAASRVDQDDIGERTADVDRQAPVRPKLESRHAVSHCAGPLWEVRTRRGSRPRSVRRHRRKRCRRARPSAAPDRPHRG